MQRTVEDRLHTLAKVWRDEVLYKVLAERVIRRKPGDRRGPDIPHIDLALLVDPKDRSVCGVLFPMEGERERERKQKREEEREHENASSVLVSSEFFCDLYLSFLCTKRTIRVLYCSLCILKAVIS